MKCQFKVIYSLLFMLMSCVASAEANLSNLVVIGDSIAAGFQSGTITPSSQQNSFPVLISKQANVNFTVPTLVPPTVLSPIPNNLAVPGERICDSLSLNSLAFNPIAVYHNVMLGSTNTQLSLAQLSQPTTMLVEMGANDILLYAILKQSIVENQISLLTGLSIDQIETGLAQGNPQLIALATAISAQIPSPLPIAPSPFAVYPTPTDTFTNCYATLMDSIASMPSAPPTIVATIPDVMASPYIKLLFAEGILNSNDRTLLVTKLSEFNNVIVNQAASHGALVYDAYATTNQIDSSGYVVGGQRLNTSFYCGIFSLDGIHPTNTTNAIIANDYIKILNSKLNAGIPPISVMQIEKVDPLIDLSLCASPTKPAGSFDSNVQHAINSMVNTGH